MRTCYVSGKEFDEADMIQCSEDTFVSREAFDVAGGLKEFEPIELDLPLNILEFLVGESLEKNVSINLIISKVLNESVKMLENMPTEDIEEHKRRLTEEQEQETT